MKTLALASWLGILMLIGPLAGLTHAAGVPVKQENSFLFKLDPEFLQAQGVQFFYELAKKKTNPSANSAAFAQARVLDTLDEYTQTGESTHVLLTRVAYSINKDISFFKASRILDPDYMNAVLPGYKISRMGPNQYRMSSMPANTFTLALFDRDQILAPGAQSPLQAIVRWEAELGTPDLVLEQHNFDFDRIMGARTSLMSRTFTAHYAQGPGKTTIIITSLSYLYNTPPFFLGGDGRVYSEAKKGALAAIQNLRDYPVQ